MGEQEEKQKRDPRKKLNLSNYHNNNSKNNISDDEFENSSMNSDDENDIQIKGAVKTSDIMALANKKRASKKLKLEKIVAGRISFKPKQRVGGSTNTEKKRKKNFVMSQFSSDNQR